MKGVDFKSYSILKRHNSKNKRSNLRRNESCEVTLFEVNFQ